MRKSRFTMVLLVLAALLFGIAAPDKAEGGHGGLNNRKRGFRDTTAVFLGRAVHVSLQAFAAAVLSKMDVGGTVLEYPDEIRTERSITTAPSLWKIENGRPVSKGTKLGRTDLIAVYNYKQRGGSRNYCSVYDFKSFNAHEKDLDLINAQINGYVQGIDDAPWTEYPCYGMRGTEWIPAIYPNWFKVPTYYYPELAAYGVDMYVTTINKMYSGTYGHAGIIYYKFQWDKKRHDEMQASSRVRSEHLGQAIYNFVKSNTNVSESMIDEYWDVLDTQIIATHEANSSHTDAWQQLIDIERPDGTIDPNTQTALVVNYLYDKVVPGFWENIWYGILKALWDVRVPGGHWKGNCPPNSVGEGELKLCA